MREFRLINALGQTAGVSERERIFFGEVDGLGFSSSLETYQVRNRLAILGDRLDAAQISGTFFFPGDDRRNTYRDIITFLRQRPLTLVYAYEGHEYKRTVEAIEVTKSETSPREAGVTFQCLSPWVELVGYRSMPEDAEGGKKYNYTYEYKYTEGAAMSVTINSDSPEPSPVRLIIYGAAEAPSWTLYVNGVATTTGKVNTTISEGQRLVIDTMSIPYKIHLETAEGRFIRDVYQDSDFSTPRFLFLEYGENRIAVAHEGTEPVRVDVEGALEYVSV